MDDTVKNEFVFYSRLARRLVVNLSESSDRILAVAWLRKFLDESTGDEKLRTIYLKLLLSCLRRRRLSGIFAKDPHCYEVLEEPPPDTDLRTSSKVSHAASAMEEEGADAQPDRDCEQTAVQYRGIDAKLPCTVCPSHGQLSQHDELATHEEMSKSRFPKGRMPQFDDGPEDGFAEVAHRDSKHESGVVEKRARRKELAPVCQRPSQTAEIMEEADCSFYVFQEAGEMDYDLFDEAPAESVYPDNPHRTVSRPAESSIHPPHEVSRVPPSGSRGTCPTHRPTLPPPPRLQPVANSPSRNQEQAFFNPFRGRREAAVPKYNQQPQLLPQERTRRQHHHSTLLPSPRLQPVANPPPQDPEEEFFNPFRGRRESMIPEPIRQPQVLPQEGTRRHHHHSKLLPSPRLQPAAIPPPQDPEEEFFNPFRGRREAVIPEPIRQPQALLQEGTRRSHHHHSILLPSPRLQPVASPPSQHEEQEFFNPFRGRREVTVPEHPKQPQFPLQNGTSRKYQPHSTLLPAPRLQPALSPPSQNQEQEFFNPFRGRREVPVQEHIEQPQFPLYEGTPKKHQCRNRRRIRAALQPRKLFMEESQVAPEVASPEPCVVSYKEESFKKKEWKGKHGSWSPCGTDEDDECSPQTMQAGQGAMLGGTHIHQSPEMYELPEPMSPQIREGYRLSQRLVDEMMLRMGDDQTPDDETLVDCDVSCSPPQTYAQRPKQRRRADQTPEEFITGPRARPGPATQAGLRQTAATEERTRARERLRDRSQQDPQLEEERCPFAMSPPASASSRGAWSSSRNAEHTADSAQKNTARRSVKKTLSYKKTWF